MDKNLPRVALNYFFCRTYSKETSLVSDSWTSKNPSAGHCVMCALATQDIYGGRVARGLLTEDWQGRLGFRSHYWNVLLSGEIVDFSRDQFPPEFPYDEWMANQASLEDKRDYVLSNSETAARYQLFLAKLESVMNSNPLFRDPKFLRSWQLAFSGESTCPKMRFACLVYKGNELIAESANKHFTTQFGKERFCSFDGRECARLGIQSRIDATYW